LKNLKKTKIILASGSPRRKYLLSGLLNNFGLNFVVKPSNIAEYIPQKIANFSKFVMDLAFLKAFEVSKKNRGIIIGADTIVVLKNNI